MAPLLVAPALERAVWAWAPGLEETGPRLLTLVPLGRLTTMGLMLIAGLLLVGLALWVRLGRSVVEEVATWGCGYVAPSSRMQYTSSSFTEMLVGMFGWVLRPRTRRPENLPLFPREAEFHSTVSDPVLDEIVLPAFRSGAWLFARFRVFQQGDVQVYLLYIFLTLIALLLWR